MLILKKIAQALAQIPSQSDTVTLFVNENGVASLKTSTNVVTTLATHDLTLLKVVNITPDVKTEGASLQHTVTLNRATAAGELLPWELKPITAGIADYISPPTVSHGVTVVNGFLLFPAGVTTCIVTIATVQDAGIETDETYGFGLAGYFVAGTITNDDALVSVHVASVSNPTAVEGQVLEYDVVLTGTTQQEETYAITLTGSAEASVDYVTSPTFTPDTVVLSNNTITVPVGLGSFKVSFNTVDNALIEGTENLIVTLEGVAGVGTITDNDATSMSALTRLNVFETPYGLLGSTQKGQVGSNGGFITVVASRSDTSTATYQVHISDAANGVYTQVAANQTYAPHYDVMGAIGYVHDSMGVENLMDNPQSISANTVGLLYDTSGQQEFSLFQPLITSTVGGETAQIFEGTTVAIWDSLPILVGYDATAHIQLLTNAYQDTTLRNLNDVVYVKVVPVNAQGVALALSSVTPIAITITGRANKPYPPRMFSYLATGEGTTANINLDQMYQFPTLEFIRYFHYIYVGNSNRLTEVTPSGYWSPNATIESSTTNYVERLDADGNIAATYTSTTNAIQQINTNWKLGNEQYRIYSKRGTIESVKQVVTINSKVRDIGTVASSTIAQVGSDIQVTVNVTAQGNNTPFVVFYDLSGTVITDEAFGTISASAGVTVDNNYALQVPNGVTQFILTIPTVSAVGKTFTCKVGNLAGGSPSTTNITVS